MKWTKLTRLLVNPALVAQRIEHLTTDQKVGGSSPSKRALLSSLEALNLLAFFSNSLLTHKQKVRKIYFGQRFSQQTVRDPQSFL